MLDRTQAVLIAKSFLGTPYKLRGMIKQSGLDCATLLCCYLCEIGAAQREDFAELELYSHDWFCNTSNERYMRKMMSFAGVVTEAICRPGPGPEPGNIVLFRVVNSKRYNHGAIVTMWPNVIHATSEGVKESNAVQYWLTSYRQMAIFNPWEKSSNAGR